MATSYIRPTYIQDVTPGEAVAGLSSFQPNLLDNSDFTNAVNQRGNTTVKARNQYIIDRWYPYFATSSSNVTLTINNNGLKVDARQATQQVSLRHFIKSPKNGKYTAVVYSAEQGVIYRCYTVDGQNATAGNSNNGKSTTLWLGWNADRQCYLFVVYTPKGYQATYKWAALYEGEFDENTIPAYVPKGYQVEMLACQRYFYRLSLSAGSVLGNGFAPNSTTDTRIMLTLPVPMVDNSPTVTLVSGSLATICNGKQTNITQFDGANNASNLNLYIRATSSGLTASTALSVRVVTASVIQISAQP